MTQKQIQLNTLFMELYKADEQLFQLNNKMKLLDDDRNKWAEEESHKLQNIKTRLSGLSSEQLATQNENKQVIDDKIDSPKHYLQLLNAIQETLRMLNAAQDTIALPEIILGHVRAGRLRQLCVSTPFIIDAAQALSFESREQEIQITIIRLAAQFNEAQKLQSEKISNTTSKGYQQPTEQNKSEQSQQNFLFQPLDLAKDQFNIQYNVSQAIILYLGASRNKNANIQLKLQQNYNLDPLIWNQQLYEQYLNISKDSITKILDDFSMSYQNFINNFFNIETKQIVIQNTNAASLDNMLDLSSIVSKFAIISRSCGDAISKLIQFIQNNEQNSVYSNIQRLYSLDFNIFEEVILDVLHRTANMISSSTDQILELFQTDMLLFTKYNSKEFDFLIGNLSDGEINSFLQNSVPLSHQNQRTDAALTLYQLAGRLCRVITLQIQKCLQIMCQDQATQSDVYELENKYIKRCSIDQPVMRKNSSITNCNSNCEKRSDNLVEGPIGAELQCLLQSQERLQALYFIQELRYVYFESLRELRGHRTPHFILLHALERQKKTFNQKMCINLISAFCLAVSKELDHLTALQAYESIGALRTVQVPEPVALKAHEHSLDNVQQNNQNEIITQSDQDDRSIDISDRSDLAGNQRPLQFNNAEFHGNREKTQKQAILYSFRTMSPRDVHAFVSVLDQKLQTFMREIVENYLNKRDWSKNFVTLLSTEIFEEQLIEIDGLEDLKEAFDAPYSSYAYKAYIQALKDRASKLPITTLSTAEIRTLGVQADQLQEHFRNALRAPVAHEFRWLRELLQKAAE